MIGNYSYLFTKKMYNSKALIAGSCKRTEKATHTKAQDAVQLSLEAYKKE